jgi:tRNA threonylcarbamoyladenosine biosynthesis protein TsaE
METLRYMTSATCITRSEGATVALGRQLGALAAQGDVYLLSGELGAGKTCLTRGIAAGLGVAEHAFSPSFVLVREYHGRLPLFHMDLYRLSNVAEVADLGIEEYFDGEGVCAIEWADRAIELLPPRHLGIELAYTLDAEDARIVRVTGAGPRYERLLDALIAATGDVASWN